MKINDRNVEDILKDPDIIDKFCKVVNVLYDTFIRVSKIEPSEESETHFLEALAIYIGTNSKVSVYRINWGDVGPLVDRYNSLKPFIDGEDVEITYTACASEHSGYLEKHRSEMVVILRAAEIITRDTIGGKYWQVLMALTLRVLTGFHGETPYSFSLMKVLYDYCASNKQLHNDIKMFL